MELQKFTDKVVGALQKFYGDKSRIECHEIYKNNGLRLQGICVMMPDQNIVPTIYLNHFYERYQSGETFSEIMREIIDLYEENQIAQNLDIDFFMDYYQVKGRLVLRLIHGEKNKELLKRVPHQRFQDLAVVCHCLMMNESVGKGSILIHWSHLKSWGIEEDELFEAARKNSPKLQPVLIQRMGDMIQGMFETMVEERIEEICNEYPQDRERLRQRTLEEIREEIDGRDASMLVLTNQGRYYGAACILYEGILDEVAKKLEGDFYILPSSVHEVILVKCQQRDHPEEYNEMVRQVNTGFVDPQEWLSDHIYVYRQMERKIIGLV